MYTVAEVVGHQKGELWALDDQPLRGTGVDGCEGGLREGGAVSAVVKPSINRHGVASALIAL